MKKSKLFVVEGTDGTGKATQTKILMEYLEAAGYKVYTTSFPKYDSQSSALVKMYLNGDIAKEANDVSAKAASIFYAADRYITYKKEMEEVYNSGEYIMLFDRYSGSNIIHQGAKLIAEQEDENAAKKELAEFIKWLDNLEHEDLGIPRPDCVIYLNVPIEYTEKLREGRKNKFSGSEKQDIHESDNKHLKNARLSGLMAADILGWNVIECIKDGEMRSIEDIAEEVFGVVKNKI